MGQHLSRYDRHGKAGVPSKDLWKSNRIRGYHSRISGSVHNKDRKCVGTEIKLQLQEGAVAKYYRARPK